jgi:hypothetical protein
MKHVIVVTDCEVGFVLAIMGVSTPLCNKEKKCLSYGCSCSWFPSCYF